MEKIKQFSGLLVVCVAGGIVAYTLFQSFGGPAPSRAVKMEDRADAIRELEGGFREPSRAEP